MDTHQVLFNAGYAERVDYGQIARRAAQLAKRRSLSEQELLGEI